MVLLERRRSELRGGGAQIACAQILEVGFSPNCAQQIREVAYSSEGSRFTLGDDEFEVPLIGEFNVRNAAMAISAARFYGVSLAKIRKALTQFPGHRAAAGSARRSARRKSDRRFRASSHRDSRNAASAAASLSGLPRCGPIFEPRSNTTRRAVFQQDLPDALKLADGVFISQVARLDQIPEEERLNPEAVVEAIAAVRPAGLLRAGCRLTSLKARAAVEGEGRGHDFQQRRVRWDSREVAGEVGALKG